MAANGIQNIKKQVYLETLNRAKDAVQQDVNKLISLVTTMGQAKSQFTAQASRLNNLLRPGYETNGASSFHNTPLSAMAYKTICNLNFLGNAPDCSWLKLIFSDELKIKNLSEQSHQILDEWLEDCEKVIKNIFANGTSGFYNAAFNNWADWYIQGCSCLKVDWKTADDENHDIVFSNINMRDIYVSAENWGEIIAVAHRFSLREDEAMRRFGIKNLYDKPEDIQSALDRCNSRYGEEGGNIIEFIDLCMANSKYIKWMAELTAPYVRVIINVTNSRVLTVSEEETLPYIISRTLSGSHLPYGLPFLWTVVDELEYYNALRKNEKTSIDYMADPIMMESAEFSIEHKDKDRFNPGDIIHALDSVTGRPMIQQLNVGGDARVIADILQHKYVTLTDQLLANDVLPPNSAQMTASEIIKRELQWNKRILPLIESRKFDFLMPLVKRVLLLLDSSGSLPEFPDYLFDTKNKVNISNIGVQFGGQLKNMLQMQSLSDMMTFLSVATQMGCGDYIDAKETLNKIATHLNIPTSCIRTTEEVMESRQQQMQVQQMQQTEEAQS